MDWLTLTIDIDDIDLASSVLRDCAVLLVAVQDQQKWSYEMLMTKQALDTNGLVDIDNRH